jgi:hypothetical protein
MLENDVPRWLLDATIVVAGLSLQLAIHSVFRMRRDGANAEDRWLALWAGALSGVLLATAWVSQATSDSLATAAFVRSSALVVATTVALPTAAVFSGRAVPWRWTAVVLAVGAVRTVLFATTDLVYDHSAPPARAPAYGPLIGVLSVPAVIVLVGLAVYVWARPPGVDRTVFAGGVVPPSSAPVRRGSHRAPPPSSSPGGGRCPSSPRSPSSTSDGSPPVKRTSARSPTNGRRPPQRSSGPTAGHAWRCRRVGWAGSS